MLPIGLRKHGSRLAAAGVLLVSLLLSVVALGQGLTTEILHNATYTLSDPELGTVTLNNCLANDAATGRRVNGTYHIAYGDFDRDGLLDAAIVVMHQTNRNAPVTGDLILVRNNAGKPEQLAATRISETCLIRSLEVRNGDILLDVNTERRCDEEMCAFTKREIHRYTLRGRTLTLEFAKSFPIYMAGVSIDMAERRSMIDSIRSALR